MPVTITEPSTPQRRKGLRGTIILLIIVVSVIGYFMYQTISLGSAALMVESNPTSIVFVNGESMGKTPIELEMKAEELVLKLVPESFSVPLSPYETKVKLTEGVKTIVRRNFEEGEVAGSGEIISFEKTGSDTSLAIVSVPDGVEVSVDGQTEGVAPLKIDITPGEHDIKLSSSGYKETSLKVRTVRGYTLTVVVDMAKTQEEEKDSEAPSPIVKVKIDDTSVGYLRVRAEASVLSEEVGRVEPGDEYEVIDQDKEENWYKIEYEEGKQGWVSGELVSQIEEE